MTRDNEDKRELIEGIGENIAVRFEKPDTGL